MSYIDTESFRGKIVCNLDGRTLLIDTKNAQLSNIEQNDKNINGMYFFHYINSNIWNATGFRNYKFKSLIHSARLN